MTEELSWATLKRAGVGSNRSKGARHHHAETEAKTIVERSANKAGTMEEDQL